MDESRPLAQPRVIAPSLARRAIVGLVAGIVAFVLLLLAVSASTRLAVQTVVLFPSFFAALPGSPLDHVTAAPVAETVELAPVDGFVRAHVYRPPSGQHAALVLSLGLDPAPPDDPRIVRLLTGLARGGLVALLVESEALDHDQLYPDLPRALVEGVQFAQTQPYVRRDRVGIFGFSVGGSLALVASADPAIRDRLRLVDAFGSYAELQDALLSVTTHTLNDDGTVRRWEPDPVAQQHLANSLIGALSDPAEVTALSTRFVEGDDTAVIDPTTLSPQARSIYELLTSRDRAAAAMLLAGLPPVAAQNFVALSPLAHVPEIRTRLFIMYDRDDPLLPFTGSRALCRAARAAGLDPYCSAFAIFQHVDPTRGGNPMAVSHDLVELFLHVFALLRLLQ
ncbi:MAG: dienelactone hydrolase family protein [Dehalococcoidia bacterium]